MNSDTIFEVQNLKTPAGFLAFVAFHDADFADFSFQMWVFWLGMSKCELEKLNEIELEKLNEMWVRKTQRTSEAVKSAQMLKPTPFLVWDRLHDIGEENKTQMQTPVSGPVTSRWDLLKFESPPLLRRACDSMISCEFFYLCEFSGVLI